MPIGSRTKKKKSSLSDEQKQAAIDSVTGITLAAYLAAAADGEVSDSEYTAIAGIVYELFEGKLNSEQVVSILEGCSEDLAQNGFLAVMEAVVAKLPDDAAKFTALHAVAGIVLGDEDYDAENEGQYYDDLAERLGVSEEDAATIWNSQVEAYGWES